MPVAYIDQIILHIKVSVRAYRQGRVNLSLPLVPDDSPAAWRLHLLHPDRLVFDRPTKYWSRVNEHNFG